MTDQHPLTETAAAALWDDHWDTGRVYWADTGAERGMPDPHILDALRAAHDAGREHAEKATASLPPQHVVFEKDNEWIEKGLDYRARLLSLVEFTANWQPAPTPPAEEVELPSEHPAHLLDVKGDDGDVCAYMALDRFGDWCGVTTQGRFRDWRARNLVAFTLPDGTRAHRDGEHEDGTPRFVKVREGEK